MRRGVPGSLLAAALAACGGAPEAAPPEAAVEARPPTPAEQALALLRRAGDDGLDPAWYGVDSLVVLAGALADQPAPAAVAAFEGAVTAALISFATDLHTGRIEPRQIGFRLSLPPERHDVGQLVRQALAGGRLDAMLDELRPRLVLYRRLREALRSYRELSRRADTIPLPAVSRSVHPGEVYPGLRRLAERLHLLGDLHDLRTPASDTLTDDMVEALRRFQDRHGLAPDGILGRGTLAALNVPLSRRVLQLEFSLERLRWLPDLDRGRFIAVNIPTFQLWVWDSVSLDGAPTFGMNVIVGRAALNTRTPVFLEEMRYVIFRPYWNVPPGILRDEVLPELSADAGWLDRNGMEIVRGAGDDATPVPPTPEHIAALAEGRLRVRQRPGPRNALGLIKFMFPNNENVYLHDTPAPELFSWTRRDFSHGCVRVERPADLAAWVLRDVPGWDRERITRTMQEGHSTRVDLRSPIPVLLFYTTAIVQPDGTVQFFADLYEHDARLERALTGGRQTAPR